MKANSERLQKVLAQHGVGSRREVERWIVEGRLNLNKRPAQIGDRYSEGDRVELDGRDITRRLEIATRPQVIAYHKPQGQAIERSEGVEDETVEERLPQPRGIRWTAINPMHPGDSGLLLFTNDGALSYALTRHKKKIPASYLVRVHVRGGVAAAPELPTTLRLDDETIEFEEVTVNTSGLEVESESGNVWYKVVLQRADKRAAVRALFVSQGLTISRMTQVSFGSIELTKDMPRARHHALTPVQVASLYALAGISVPKMEEPGKRVAASERMAKDKESVTKERPQRGPRSLHKVREAMAKTSRTTQSAKRGVPRDATKSTTPAKPGERTFGASKGRSDRRPRKA